MADEQGKCMYHNIDNRAYCRFTERPCFGAYIDESKKGYVIDIWKEQECPNYKYDDNILLKEETPAKSDLNGVFEKQKEESIAGAQIEVIDGEIVNNRNGRVEIILFGSKIAVECTDEGCNMPESIDIDAEVLQHYFSRKYGLGVIEVKWVDVLSPELESYNEVNEYIGLHNTYPIVTINGILKFVGSISVDLINNELEKLGIIQKNLD